MGPPFPRSSARRPGLPLVLLALVACYRDPADRLYIEALRGEETGMTRQQQVCLLDRALAIAPDRAHVLETRAIYHIDLRDFSRARADLDRAIALADRPYLHFLRGLVACQGGLCREALADFDIAIESQPTNTQFYRGRALARAEVGMSADALIDAEHLVAEAPQWAESYYARGMALAGLGRDLEALAEFDEALRRRPELVYPLAARAASFERLGDAQHAAVDREEAARKAGAEGSYAVCLDPFRY